MTKMMPLAELLGMPSPDANDTPDDHLQDGLSIEGRGRLLSVPDVQKLLFFARTERWVKRKVLPEKRILVGHLVCWWESDIRTWLDGLRGRDTPMRRETLQQINRSRRGTRRVGHK